MQKTAILFSALLIATTFCLLQPAAAQNAPAPAQAPPPPSGELRTIPAGQAHQMIDLDSLLERLGKDLDIEFVVSPVAPRMLPVIDTNVRTASLESLRALLRVNSLVAIAAGNQILILPDALARSMPTRIVQADDEDISDHEIVTRIVDVPSMADNPSGGVAVLVPALRPVMPQSAMLAAVAGTTQLVIVDYYDNVKRITAMIRELTN